MAVKVTVRGAEPRSGVAVVAHAARAADGSQNAAADGGEQDKTDDKRATHPRHFSRRPGVAR